jgi:hypothetical protein
MMSSSALTLLLNHYIRIAPLLAAVTIGMGFPKGRSAALPLVAIGVHTPMAKYI